MFSSLKYSIFKIVIVFVDNLLFLIYTKWRIEIEFSIEQKLSGVVGSNNRIWLTTVLLTRRNTKEVMVKPKLGRCINVMCESTWNIYGELHGKEKERKDI